jgi:hypothetical protein
MGAAVRPAGSAMTFVSAIAGNGRRAVPRSDDSAVQSGHGPPNSDCGWLLSALGRLFFLQNLPSQGTQPLHGVVVGAVLLFEGRVEMLHVFQSFLQPYQRFSRFVG